LGGTPGSLGVAVTVTGDGPKVDDVNPTFTDRGSPGPKVTVDGDTLTDRSFETSDKLMAVKGDVVTLTLNVACEPAPERSRFNDSGLTFKVTVKPPPPEDANGFLRKYKFERFWLITFSPFFKYAQSIHSISLLRDYPANIFYKGHLMASNS